LGQGASQWRFDQRQTGALIAARKKFLAAQKEHLARQGLNTAEIEAIENQKRVETREKRLSEIKSDALTFQKNAAELLKMGKDETTDLLANMGIIHPRHMNPAVDSIPGRGRTPRVRCREPMGSLSV
jgi:hypothetical protein